MRKIILICILLFSVLLNLSSQSRFNRIIDSLENNISQLIANDLIVNYNFVISQRPWWTCLGDSYELKIVFDEECTYTIVSNKPDDSKHHKLDKSYTKFRLFNLHLNNQNELPYNFFKYFKYIFLIGKKEGDLFSGDAIFGEYKFKATPLELIIIDKKIETLTGEDKIIEKYNADW
ncbi:hypothetical protein SDC9_100987 [bioreactor metagenome]|uniref:Uncharacterized protein n=1 Tax=bioreactor metagenome TaxID=1076179 RepID=A0A645ATK1_9ZZZZ|nr:hypothetical protein [Paludibacter sp.]